MKGMKILAILTLFVILSTSVLALRGSIGNARIYIDEVLKSGELKVVERSVKVNNHNNVTIVVKVAAADGIENITQVIDEEFTLEPGESKRARFKVRLEGNMSVEGRIAVGFSPANPFEGGPGVGLQSVVLVNTFVDDSLPEIEPPDEPDISPQEVIKNPIVGVAIIVIIMIIGVLLYLLIAKRVR